MGDAHGAAEGAAVVVLFVYTCGVVLAAGYVAGGAGGSQAGLEPAICVQSLVVEDIKGGAVKGVGSGLGDEAFDAGGGASELRRGRGRGYLELLQRLYRGRGFIEGGAVFGAGNAGTVEQDLGSVALAAGDLAAKDSVAVEVASAAAASAGAGGSGDEEDEVFRRAHGTDAASDVKGEIDDLPSGDGASDIGGFSLDTCTAGVDSDGFRDGAGRKSDVQRGGGIDEDLDAGIGGCGEARSGRGDGVDANRQGGKAVGTRGGRDGLVFTSRRRVGGGYLRIGNDSPGCIGDASGELSAGGLSKGVRGEDERRDHQQQTDDLAFFR